MSKKIKETISLKLSETIINRNEPTKYIYETYDLCDEYPTLEVVIKREPLTIKEYLEVNNITDKEGLEILINNKKQL